MSGGRPKSETEVSAVKSVTKVLDILEHVGSSKIPVNVSDIARATGFNVSTAYRLLQTLAARGYVEQKASDRCYVLGHRVFQLGSAYLEGHDLVSLVRPHLDVLRDTLGETVYLTILRQGENVQLCKADGQHIVSASARSVEREPAFCTAGGKVLLSGLSSDDLERYAETISFHAYTTHTVSNKSKLINEIKKVGQQGYALDLEEFAKDLCCVSVPVCRQGSGSVVAAISVAMPKIRFERTSVASWVKQLQEKSNLVSRQIGLLAI